MCPAQRFFRPRLPLRSGKRVESDDQVEEAVHAPGPVFLPDVDQDLEFAQVIGVAGRVTHAIEGKVTGVIVMDEGARDVPVDIAASGADAQDDQERGAQHVELTGAAFDANSGFVEMFDRGHGPDPVDDILEVLYGAPAHGSGRGCGHWQGKQVAHEVGQSCLGTDPCSRSLTHAVMRGPYWTRVVTPVGKVAPVTVPKAPQRQRWTRCSVISSGCRSGRSKIWRQTGAP